MLTKDDLQAIEQIVETKVDFGIKKELKPIRRQLNRMENTIDVMVGFFNREDVALRKRVERLEVHVGIDT